MAEATIGKRTYPSTDDLKDVIRLEQTIRRVLDDLYYLRDQVESLKATKADKK